MRILLDSNLLIYARNSGDKNHGSATVYLQNIFQNSTPYALTWVNIYEFIRAVTHRAAPSPLDFQAASTWIMEFVRHPSCELLAETPRHFEMLTDVAAEAGLVHGNFVHDCHIAALMKEHGLDRIATADSGFRRFPFLKVIDFRK